MALMKCPECFGNCSDKATACPHCGFLIRNKPDYKAILIDKLLIKLNKKLLIKSAIIMSIICGFFVSIYYYYNYILTPNGLASTILSKMANGEIILYEQNPLSRGYDYPIYNMNEKLCEDIAVRNNTPYSFSDNSDKCPPTGYSFFMDPSDIVSLKLGKKKPLEKELWALESVSESNLKLWEMTLGKDKNALKYIEDRCKSEAPDSCVYNKKLERYEWKEKCTGYQYYYDAETKDSRGRHGGISSSLDILKCPGHDWRVAGF